MYGCVCMCMCVSVKKIWGGLCSVRRGVSRAETLVLIKSTNCFLVLDTFVSKIQAKLASSINQFFHIQF